MLGKKFVKTVIASSLCLMVPVSLFAAAGVFITPTKGSVVTVAGKEIRSEMPLAMGDVVKSKGTSMVQGDGIQLGIGDGAAFTLAGTPKSLSVNLQAGQIDFSAISGSAPASFSANKESAQVVNTLFPKSGPLKGCVRATATGLEVGAADGAMELKTAQGTYAVKSGQGLIVEGGKSRVGSVACVGKPVGALAGGAGAGAGAAVGAGASAGMGAGTAAAVGAAAVGAAAAGAAAGIASGSSGGSGH